MDAVNVEKYLSLVGLDTSLPKCSLNIAQYESDLVRKESIFGLRQMVSRDSAWATSCPQAFFITLCFDDSVIYAFF